MTLSFGFIVGGDDSYYKNLMRACESLERVSQTHEIVILDMDDRLEIDDPKVKIVSGSAEKVENKDDRNWFQPHIWKERFNLYKHVETDHCIYLDTDTVVIHDRVNELIKEAEDDFLIARQIKVNHFTFKLSHREHSPKAFSIYLAEPESDAAMFLLLSQLHLDKIHDVQEIDSLTLSADRFFSATSLSGDLFHGTRFQQKDGRMTGLADRENNNRFFNILRARLGPDACFGLAEANDHRPEKAWKVVSQSMQSKRKESSSGENPRPMFLLPKPRRLRLHDGQPWFNAANEFSVV